MINYYGLLAHGITVDHVSTREVQIKNKYLGQMNCARYFFYNQMLNKTIS